MSEELSPCPFCGSEHVLIYDTPNPNADVLPNSPRLWVAQCMDCGNRTGTHVRMSIATAAWNRRAERTCAAVTKETWEGHYHKCCGCGYAYPSYLSKPYPFCPGCGARVAGVGDES